MSETQTFTTEKYQNAESGDAELAKELHEANLDWAASLGADVDAVLGDKTSLESPGFSVSRVEIPRPASDDGEPGFRYDFNMSESDRLRTGLTITVMDGRPEFTFHTEPVDTEKHPATTDSPYYTNGSWNPEDVSSEGSEAEWNKVFTQAGEGLRAARSETKRLEDLKGRSFGRKVLDRYMALGSKK